MDGNRFKKQAKYLAGILSSLLLFQNCTPNGLTVDEDQKRQILARKNLLLNSTASKESKIVNFTFVCAHDESTTPKDLLRSGELKVVIEKYDFESKTTSVICEVEDVKKEILNTRSVDLSVCDEIPDPQKTHLDLYIVPENIQSNFDQHKINIDTTPLALGGYTLNYMSMKPDTQNSACDEAGAPLMLQLSSRGPALSLTAPTDGVEIDLLGGKSYQIPHDKVVASWFTPNSAGDVFVLVKPNKDHLVLGADEMFADTSLGPDAKYAKQGFAALEKYDDNKDLIISEDDVIFSELRLWQDSDHDGQVQESELSTLGENKVRAIDLRYSTQHDEIDIYGNQILNKSIIVMEDNSYGIVFDLGLRFIHRVPKSEEKFKERLTASPEPAMTAPAPPAHTADSGDQHPAAADSQMSESHEAESLPESTPDPGEPSDPQDDGDL